MEKFSCKVGVSTAVVLDLAVKIDWRFVGISGGRKVVIVDLVVKAIDGSYKILDHIESDHPTVEVHLPCDSAVCQAASFELQTSGNRA